MDAAVELLVVLDGREAIVDETGERRNERTAAREKQLNFHRYLLQQNKNEETVLRKRKKSSLVLRRLASLNILSMTQLLCSVLGSHDNNNTSKVSHLSSENSIPPTRPLLSLPSNSLYPCCSPCHLPHIRHHKQTPKL